MTMYKYKLSKYGVKAMANDTLDMIFSALSGENKDFNIDELEFKITVGNKEIRLPIYAEVYEMLFDCLEDIEKEVNEEEILNG